MVVRAALVAAAALALAPAALAADTVPSAPVYDEQGHLIQTPFTPQSDPAKLTKERAEALLLAAPGVRDWVKRYPAKSLVKDATFEDTYRYWDVKVWSGRAGEIAAGHVDDLTGQVLEAWTGPQVAWSMARGQVGSFGGKEINSWPVWGGFCFVFLLGLADWRRLRSLRNLDLLVLLSFSVSLYYFNHGRIFTSVPLVYPPLLYLLARTVWLGARGRATRAGPPVWPVWVLAAATVFATGFRIGLDIRDSNVIDVGYSGVIGAERIVHEAEMPYGHMPVTAGKPCSPAAADGSFPYVIQTNGRCESQDERGDTYGPVSYEAYIPGYLAVGWTGKGDTLDAARFTSIMWDLLAIIGMGLVGLRFGGRRLAMTLAFAWASYPFTQYVLSSNTNDAIQPALLIWGFWLVSSPAGRGIFAALSGWTKYASLIVAPLWLTYPEWRGRRRDKVIFLAGFAVATVAAFWVLLLEPSLWGAIKTFWHRGVTWQIGRESPFSIWDWRQYHAGLPNLHVLQYVLEGLLLLGAVAAAFLPRRKSPLQLAALTAALLIGFELVLTHWFYLYIPWFFPFVAFAVLAPAVTVRQTPADEHERETRELVATG